MLDPKITAAAQKVLALANVSRPPVPVQKLAELAGAEIRLGAMPSGLSGFLLRKDGRPVIGVNKSQAKVRQRFTIAHEIGHLMLHPDQSYVDRGFQVQFRDARSATAEDLAEIQANQFAADLLMPRSMLDAALKDNAIDIEDEENLEHLAARFEVSKQALVFRLINLGFAASTPEPKPKRRR